MERIAIPFPVIVEGKYDKLRLESVIDAQILTKQGNNILINKCFSPTIILPKWVSLPFTSPKCNNTFSGVLVL